MRQEGRAPAQPPPPRLLAGWMAGRTVAANKDQAGMASNSLQEPTEMGGTHIGAGIARARLFTPLTRHPFASSPGKPLPSSKVIFP